MAAGKTIPPPAAFVTWGVVALTCQTLTFKFLGAQLILTCLSKGKLENYSGDMNWVSALALKACYRLQKWGGGGVAHCHYPSGLAECTASRYWCLFSPWAAGAGLFRDNKRTQYRKGTWLIFLLPSWNPLLNFQLDIMKRRHVSSRQKKAMHLPRPST